MRGPSITKTSVVDKDLRHSIDALMDSCLKNGDDIVPYPLDEEDCFHYLLWDALDNASGLSASDEHTRLIGALAVLPLFDDTAECIACVRPDHRQEGCFSRFLFPRVLEDFSDLTFVFPVRGKYPADGIHPAISSAAQKALASIGAEYDRTEYMMELSVKDSPLLSDAESQVKDPGGIFDASLPEGLSLSLDEGEPIATCRLERISADTACLYAVEVKPEERNKGFGTRLLCSVTELLKKCGITTAIVHVSASNLPALSLYEKAGFRTTETLSYYTF